MDSSFGRIGLPNGVSTKLAYHAPTQTIVALVEPRANLPPHRGIYFRRAADVRYQPVATLPDDISIDSYAIDVSRPDLYFLTYEWKPIPGRKAVGGNWDALYRFDLEEHRSERLTGRGELRPPAGVDQTWLKAILSLSSDGQSIFCTAAFMTQQLAEYWVCELSLGEMRLKPITRLEAVFA